WSASIHALDSVLHQPLTQGCCCTTQTTMNVLPIETQAAVVSALVEGNSIRSTERMVGVHRDTITRLVLRIGAACERMRDERMRDLPCEHIQADELWCFVGKKQRHVTA